MSRGLLTPDVNAPIDWVDPINRLHPLNRGLVGWWLCVPGAMGGKTLLDLCRRNHGTLTGMDPQLDWQAPRGRPGGWGCLDFDGTNDYIVLTVDQAAQMSGRLTTAAWAKANAATLSMTAVCFRNSSNGIGITYLKVTNSGTAYMRGIVGPGGVNVSAQDPVALDTNWHHWTVTYNGAAVVLYKDGALAASSAASGTLTTPTAWSIGSQDAGAGTWWAGPIDDVRHYDRALSAAEVYSLYTLSRQFYPGLLNRVRIGPRVSAAAAATVFTRIVGQGGPGMALAGVGGGLVA